MKRISLLIALLAPLAWAAQASASFHLVKISEVHPDPAAGTFAELQMLAGGQNQLGGHAITTFDAGGGLTGSYPLDDVTSGQSQRTVLIGDAGVAARDIAADGLGADVEAAAGAICFATIDCVAWGPFAGSLPSPAGTPAAPTGIASGLSLTRSIAPGCATSLEASDDTDDSLTDFALTTPSPRSNNDAPTEIACGGRPETIIEKGPRKQSTKAKAKFRFSSPDPVTGFECSLDGKRFKPCSSPQIYKRLKRSRHTFEVRAVSSAGTDSSPATYKWKVRKPKP